LQIPEFQAAYREARSDTFSQSIARLPQASSAAKRRQLSLKQMVTVTFDRVKILKMVSKGYILYPST
jgi:hypothetical protein